MWRQIITYPPRLIELASFDLHFNIFSHCRKKYLSDMQFSSDNDIIASLEDFFQGQKSHDELLFKTGIQKLHEQWDKCTEVQ